MSRYFALLSIVFMMGFVMVFDKVHLENCNVRFCKKGVLSRQEVDQLLRIMSACGECSSPESSYCSSARNTTTPLPRKTRFAGACLADSALRASTRP